MFNNLGLAILFLWIKQKVSTNDFRHKNIWCCGNLLRNIVHRSLHLTELASSCPNRAKRANSHLS